MAKLEKRVSKLEQGRSGIYAVAVAFDDEDAESAIERCCRKNGITRQAFDTSPHTSIIRVRFVGPKENKNRFKQTTIRSPS